MWGKRYLVVWTVVALAASTAADCFLQGLLGGKGGLQGLLGGKGDPKTPVDKITPEDVLSAYSTVMETFKKMNGYGCIHSLCFHSAVKVLNGNVVYDVQKVTMTLEKESMVFTPDGYVSAPIKFQFPSDMTLNLGFEYKYTQLKTPQTKKGISRYLIGPITITVMAKLPADKEKLSKMPTLDNCVNKIPPSAIVTEASGQFTNQFLHYEPNNHDAHKTHMLTYLNEMKPFIISNVCDNLRSQLVRMVQNVIYSCLDDDSKLLLKYTFLKPAGGLQTCPSEEC